MSYEQYYTYLRELKSGAITPIAKLEFLNMDDSPAFDVGGDFISNGSITTNFQDGVRRTATTTINNWDEIYRININNIWVDQKIRIMAGLFLTDGSEYYIPQGVFYVTNPDEVYSPTQRTVTLNLVDKWGALDGTVGGTLGGIYQINTGDNLFAAIQQLLLINKGNGLPIDPIAPVFDSYYKNKTSSLADGTTIPFTTAPYTLRTEGDQTYADVLLGINTMLVSSIGYDKVGQFRLQSAQADIRDNDRPISWRFSVSEREFYNATFTHKMAEMYNDVVVVGAIINGTQVKGRATNTNPASDCCVQKIGRKTYYLTNSKLYTYEQCDELAKYHLRKLTMVQKSVTFTTAPIFHLQENSLVTLLRPEISDVPEKYLVTGYTLPLGASGAMTINAVSVSDINIFDKWLPSYTLSVLCSQIGALRLKYGSGDNALYAALNNPYDIVEIPPGVSVTFEINPEAGSSCGSYIISSAVLNGKHLVHTSKSCTFTMPSFNSSIVFVLSATDGTDVTFTYTGEYTDTNEDMDGVSYRLIVFTTSGTLTFNADQEAAGITGDIWIRGGGGGGNSTAAGKNGYDANFSSEILASGDITIGAGGVTTTDNGRYGEATVFGDYSARGGAGARTTSTSVGGSLEMIFGSIENTTNGVGGAVNAAGNAGILYIRIVRTVSSE